ncbi:MAG: tetratricopeptide repeat protein [Candidatus Erginobacter occultus]|nr:tetratricopeptide repeat protein [Candidatus Erginobacter occultus]
MEPDIQHRKSTGSLGAGGRPGRAAWLLAGVLAAAVLFRAVYFIELLDSPFGRHPVLDAGYYYNWAVRLAAGGFRYTGDFSGNPLYAYFLAFLVRFLRAGPVLIRAFQHLLGVLTCLLVYRCGRKLSGEKTALAAALLYAVFPPAVFYEGWLLSASLEAFLMTALLAVLLSAGDRSRAVCFGGGLLAGLLLLARPSLVPLGAAAWILFGSRGVKFGRRAAGLLLFALGLILPLLPFSLQYYSQEKEIVFVSPHGGENFYIGNRPGAFGLGQMPEFARGMPELQRRDFRAEASRQTGRALSPGESSRFWFGRGAEFIETYPLKFFRLLAVKTYFFFCGGDFSDNYHLSFFRRLFFPLALPFTWRMLSALALAGLIAGRLPRKPTGLFHIFLFSYVLSIVLFFVTSRFRIPAVPLFCLAAAGWLAALGRDLGRRRLLPAAGRIALVMILFILLAGPAYRPPFYAIYTSAAEVYARDGQMDRAGEFLRLAGEEHEGDSAPLTFRSYRHYLARAQVELKRGNMEEAEEIFSRILAEVKERPGALHFEIANVWAENLHYEKAEEHYRAAIAADPGDFRALNNLGLTLKARGKGEEAEAAFLRAVEANPGYAAARGNLGNLYFDRGEWAAAAREFRAALELDPGVMARFRIALAYCLRRLGRPAEAEEELRKCPPGLLAEFESISPAGR